MSRSPCQLVTGLVLMGVALVALVVLNPTHFTSPDSGYYLQAAASLLAGRGYVVGPDGHQVWNGLFPVGYPGLIAAVSGLTGLPVLWASKWVNFLAVAVSAGLWVRRVGAGRACWLVSIWWTGGFLRILAYTWSETVFLVLLAEWVWCLNSFLKWAAPQRAMQLAGLSVALFLVRYVGGCVAGLMALFSIIIFLNANWFEAALRLRIRPRRAGLLLAVSAVSAATMGFYGGMNHHFSGSVWGGERLMPAGSVGSLLGLFCQAVGNELLLIRDFMPGSSPGLAWAGLAVELIWVVVVYKQLGRNPASALRQPAPQPDTTLIRLFVGVGGLYAVVLFGLRVVSPFSGPDARLMAPATFCLLMAALLRVGTTAVTWQQKLRPYWMVLLAFSWLQLMPQQDLGAKMGQVWVLLSRTAVQFRE